MERVSEREVWYCWRELATVEGEDEPRLLVPVLDPYEFETLWDYVYETREEALEGRQTAFETEVDEVEAIQDWKLVKMTLEVVDG